VSAADLAAVLVSMAALGALIVLIVTAQSLLRTLREVRQALDRIRLEAVPLVEDMRSAVSSAGAEVERVDELLDAAASIQHTVDHASRLTYLAFSNPLIKFVAFFRGLGRGVGRAFGAGGRRRRRVESRRQQRENKRAA
jgi:hypothetical protein